MRRLLPIILVVMIIGLAPLAHAIGQNQLFWDDFIQSGFPSQWFATNTQNVTQSGGYLVATVQRNQSTSGQRSFFLVGNQSVSPFFQTLTPTSSQFVQVVFKMQPFNFTNPTVKNCWNAGQSQTTPCLGAAPTICSEVIVGMGFGFAANAVPLNAVFFDLMQCTISIKSNFSSYPPNVKQSIILGINRPALPANAYWLTGAGSGTDFGILYNGANAAIDLNAMHTFTVQMNINSTDTTKTWVGWSVDGSAFVKLWQNACSCITGGAIANIFPIFSSGVSVTGVGTTYWMTSQSFASQVDYVLATDYIPTTLPQGQLLSSNINPPKQLPQPTFGGGTSSLTQFVQFYANQWGGGNIYAGGMLLTGVILFICATVGGLVVLKMRAGFGLFGMMFNFLALVTAFFFFYAGVIPIWIPAITTIGATAIAFGIVKGTVKGEGGGFVPD